MLELFPKIIKQT